MIDLQPLTEVPGHPGFCALPSDPERLAYVAKLSAGMRGISPQHVTPPSTQHERQVVWRTLNENLAQLRAEDSLCAAGEDHQAVVALSTALGRKAPDATSKQPNPTAIAVARIKALGETRERCRDILAAGYLP